MWAGRVVFGLIVAGLAVYLFKVGLDDADKLGSSIGGVAAVAALLAPYLLPRREEDAVPDEVVVEDSGDADATGGGEANTGVETVDGDPGTVRVTRSGNAVADGPGSVANTGVRRRPRT
ncbi:hypothetical protein GCM10027184_72480 [Saccharothrix stipae]